MNKFKNIPDAENVTMKLKHSLNIQDVLDDGATFEFDNDNDINVAESRLPNFSKKFGDNFDDENDIFNLCSGYKNEANNRESSDSDDELDPFELLARKMEDITPNNDGGVLKMEIKPGVGGDIPPRSKILFHYKAYLEFGDEPFDSTILRDKPERAHLDQNDTLPGLKIGLRTMRKKEQARFLIKPLYAFGELGCPPRIPPDSTILYEVTLLDARDFSDAADFENYTFEQQHKASFEEKYKAALANHKQGTGFFKSGNLIKAKNCYRKATWILTNATLSNEEEEKKQCELLFKTHSNLAQVNLDLGEPKKACSECKEALSVNYLKIIEPVPLSKVFYRFGKAKLILNDCQSAKKLTQKAQAKLPNSVEIRTQLEEIIKRSEKNIEIEKVMYSKMINMKPSSELKQDSNNTESNSITKSLDDFSGVSNEIKVEFKRMLKAFAQNDKRTEFVLPPSLTACELEYITALAHQLNLKCKKQFINQRFMWKVVKAL